MWSSLTKCIRRYEIDYWKLSEIVLSIALLPNIKQPSQFNGELIQLEIKSVT